MVKILQYWASILRSWGSKRDSPVRKCPQLQKDRWWWINQFDNSKKKRSNCGHTHELINWRHYILPCTKIPMIIQWPSILQEIWSPTNWCEPDLHQWPSCWLFPVSLLPVCLFCVFFKVPPCQCSTSTWRVLCCRVLALLLVVRMSKRANPIPLLVKVAWERT